MLLDLLGQMSLEKLLEEFSQLIAPVDQIRFRLACTLRSHVLGHEPSGDLALEMLLAKSVSSRARVPAGVLESSEVEYEVVSWL